LKKPKKKRSEQNKPRTETNNKINKKPKEGGLNTSEKKEKSQGKKI